jgi:parvulin-like peptidyl-prolyl isomerase
VRDAVITDVQHTAPFVNARHILVADEATANTALQALQGGESFAELAKALSTDGSASSGGELGWAPASNYVKEFADAVTTAEIGALVGPVKSQFGYHIIQVRAREDRDMTDSEYETALNNKFTQYLKDLRAADTTNVQVYDAWTDNVPTEPVFIPSI